MSEKQDVQVEMARVCRIVDELRTLDDDARQRVLAAAIALLGMEIPRTKKEG